MQPNGQQHRLPVPLTAYPSFGMHPYAPPVMHPFGQPFVMQFPPPVMVPQQPPSRAQQQYAAAEEEDDDDDNYEEEIAEYGAGMDEPAVASTTAFSLLLPELQRAVAQEGYHNPTPIQAQAIPHLLQGRDILGCAQTGTGKTAAFTLPMLEYLTKHPIQLKPRYPRALILAPTRELAAQIGDSIGAYGRYLKVSHAVVFGGVGQEPQVQAVQRGLSILVATPGRLLDLMGQGYVHLEHIEIFVLDEADRMLDMGFLPDVKRVISALPAKRQSLFFSATLEPPVVALANTLVRNPVHITVTPEHPTVDRISQRVLFVDKENKAPLLVHILRDPSVSKVIVFTQMKHQANKVVQHLSKSGISAVAIHGNKSQTARLQALAGFKANTVRVLAATDIAARGLDIDGVSHVVNFDLPNVPETYVHRIGRTGRAGAGGDSISFCAAEERDFLRDIERFIRRPVPVDVQHPFHSVSARDATGAAARPPPKQQRGGRQEKRAGGSGGGGGGGGGGGKRGGGGRGGGFAGNAPQHAQGHSQPHAPHHPQSQVQQHAPAAQSHQGGGGGGGGGGGQRRGRGGRGGGGGGGGGGGAPRQAQQGQGQSQGGSRGGGGGGRGGRGRGQATGPGH